MEQGKSKIHFKTYNPHNPQAFFARVYIITFVKINAHFELRKHKICAEVRYFTYFSYFKLTLNGLHITYSSRAYFEIFRK